LKIEKSEGLISAPRQSDLSVFNFLGRSAALGLSTRAMVPDLGGGVSAHVCVFGIEN
jgi:hypothetical protein